MKHTYKFAFVVAIIAIASVFTFQYFGEDIKNLISDTSISSEENNEEEEGDKRTRIQDMYDQQFELTKDLSLGYVPTERLLTAVNYAKTQSFTKNTPITAARWKERGPYNVGGRTRTMLIDANDPTGKAAFAAGVAGGLWYSKDVMGNNVKWEPVNDYLENLAIVTLVQDPNNPQIMYFGTGEAYGNTGSVRGLGIFKSTDGGLTWNRLPNANFYYTMRMAIHTNGDIYAATDGDGVQRSQDGGQTWTKVLGLAVSFGTSNACNDLEIGPDGSIWSITGYGGNSVIHKSEAGTDVGDVGNWTRVGSFSTGFVAGQSRVELAVAESNQDVCYALTSSGGAATFIYKTTDGGQSWSKAANAPSVGGNSNFAGDQAWYDLDIDVDPTNENRVIAGGIDVVMSVNGGTNWLPITAAYSNAAPYIHPDQHFVYFYPGSGNTMFMANDGGIYRTDNVGDIPTAISFRVINDRYNITQFYSCAIHPDYRSDYFIAGSQDNGTHRFDQYDIDITENINGGDGMVCHIDQTDGQIQIVSSQFGNYRISFNGGQSFSGGLSIGNASGFVNPSDYDNNANIMYARSTSTGEFVRWDVDNSIDEVVDMPGANNLGTITTLFTSENVDNRLYLGTSFGRVIKIDNAHTGSSVTYTATSLGGGSVSGIVTEKGNEDHMLATISNYGTMSVHESFDGGVTWQGVEGNLPDMPVRSVIFDPINADQAMIATEAGVWVTENLDGNNTVWVASLDGMPITRVDDLQYRESDNLIIAGTYGRGLFSSDYRSPSSADFIVDRIGYIGTPFQFNNRSYNPSQMIWDFGDGTTSTDFSPTHSYDVLGTYTVSLTVNDSLSKVETIRILPDRTLPYTQEGNDLYAGDFESNFDDFGVYTLSGTGFELGNSTVSAKAGTNSGQNAYVTGLTETFYQNNSESRLYTPNFDLSNEGIYELSFFAKYDLQNGWDGFNLEYTTDLGETWTVLGEEDDDWYFYTNDNTVTAFPRGTSYFTNIKTFYEQYRYDLSELVGEENVAFRFVFKTNEVGIYKGLAVDDFKIRAFLGALETQLIDFDAKFIGDERGEVTWSTLPEYECEGFDLEISENGRDFTFFGFTEGQGSSIDLTGYRVRPNNLKKDLYFVRLKVLNFDGTFFYSNIKVLQRRETELDIVNIFPNPFIDNIGITFNNIVDEEVTVNIYDATGKLAHTQTGGFDGAYMEIETSSYPTGVYFLQVIVGEKQFTRKLLKQVE